MYEKLILCRKECGNETGKKIMLTHIKLMRNTL